MMRMLWAGPPRAHAVSHRREVTAAEFLDRAGNERAVRLQRLGFNDFGFADYICRHTPHLRLGNFALRKRGSDAADCAQTLVQRSADVDLGPLASGSAADRATVASELAEACGRVGFVYLTNHGVSRADVDAIFKTAEDFHNLPLEAKMDVSITKNQHAQGYLHGMTKGVHDKISPNLQEAFQMRRPLAPDDPDILAGKPLHGVIHGRRRCPISSAHDEVLC